MYMNQDWPTIFPALLPPGQVSVEPEVRLLLDSARQIGMPAGAAVFRQGDACSHYTLVIEGSGGY